MFKDQKAFDKHKERTYLYIDSDAFLLYECFNSKFNTLLSDLLSTTLSGMIIKNQKTGKCLSIEGIGDWRPIETINCDGLTGHWDYDEGKKLKV